MIRKIFFGVLLLLLALVAFNIYGLYAGYNALTKVEDTQVLGNPQGDLTVVEFLDYQCPYCGDAHSTITQAVQQDGNIRYIIRPIAFMGEASERAVSMLYAAHKQDAFAAMHERLITSDVPENEEQVRAFVQPMGLSADMLLEDMQAEEAKELSKENMLIFARIGGRSTPTFYIGKKLRYTPVDRMPVVADFIAMFEQARAQGLKEEEPQE